MNQELTTGNRLGMQTVPQTFNEQMRFAEVVSQAKGMLPRAYEGNPANVLVAVQYGASLGIEPMAALQNIDVIQGTPTLSAKAVAALVRANGHKLWMSEDEQNMSATCTIVRNDDKEHPVTVTRDKAWAQRMGLLTKDNATCTIVRNDDKEHPVTVTRDKAWAQRMGLLTKDNYKKQPTTMLMWRAVTACANRACPELFLGLGGAYTADELHDMDLSEDTSVEATVVEDDGSWPESKVELVNRIDRIIDQLGYQGRTHMRVYELLKARWNSSTVSTGSSTSSAIRDAPICASTNCCMKRRSLTRSWILTKASSPCGARPATSSSPTALKPSCNKPKNAKQTMKNQPNRPHRLNQLRSLRSETRADS